MPFPAPGDLPHPEVEPESLVSYTDWQVDSLPSEPSYASEIKTTLSKESLMTINTKKNKVDQFQPDTVNVQGL